MNTVLLLAVSLSALLLGGMAQAGTVCVVQSPETATCREFTSTFITNDIEQKGGTGVACLQADNSWKVVSGPGFGTSFYRNNSPVAYIGEGYFINGVYQQQPSQIRYNITRKSVCVPSLPRYLRDRPPGYGGANHHIGHTSGQLQNDNAPNR